MTGGIKQILYYTRRWIFTMLALARVGSVKKGMKCGGFCLLSNNTHLGVNVSFNGMKIRGRGRVQIGDNFHSGGQCEILTENHNYEGEAIPYDSTFDIKSVEIGDNVWFGNRVMVLPGVKIGEGVIVQAGSVIVSDIPDYAIAGGHPARVFSSRNADHYQRLKANKKFH